MVTMNGNENNLISMIQFSHLMNMVQTKRQQDIKYGKRQVVHATRNMATIRSDCVMRT